MTQLPRIFGTPLKRLLFVRLPFSPPSIGQVMAGLSVLGVAGLAYLCGAAVMYFQLPSCEFLDQAFTGAEAWRKRGQSTLPLLPPEAETDARIRGEVVADNAEKTCDGFTLYTMTGKAQATLIDMRGNVVHHWQMPFSRVWPHPSHVKDPLDDDQIHWFGCYLYGNGDLLAIYHADGDTPYGYGLVKLDKDSKLLWAYPGRVHHDIDVDEDGVLYTLTHKLFREPSADLDFFPSPYLTDFLVVLSPDGRELENIPLAQAFAKSPYALTLVSLASVSKLMVSSNRPKSKTAPPPASARMLRPPAPPQELKYDVLHANSVKVLKRARAAKFPLFQPGQVLLSLRNLDTIAVLDRPTRSIVWAARGIWRAQHDAEFLDNGRLFLYDNCGQESRSRLLEYDLRTQATPWSYSNENSTSFQALYRGGKQRLPNGNTLIVDPDDRRLLEVTRSKELVWENYCPLPADPPGLPRRSHAVNTARRYSADELTFLKGVVRVR
ncbi:MAG TPA: arylsulfotransferase family protein [Gemmataceae bacterium]|nr:arylsulfotransferase family protein [Gemmataceae bacterium]